MSPLRLKRRVVGAEMARPDDAALHVERDDLPVAEPGVDALAVGDRRRRGEVVLLVDLGHRPGRLRAVFPQPLAVGAAEGFHDEPDVARACASAGGGGRRSGSPVAQARGRPARAEDVSRHRRPGLRCRSARSTNTRSPQTIGDDVPRPASGARQAMFCFALHVVGRRASGDTPELDGPRHCGQFCAAISEAARITHATSAEPRGPTLLTCAFGIAVGIGHRALGIERAISACLAALQDPARTADSPGRRTR